MEYVKMFLMNNIVIVWVAPIVTAVVATLLIRLFSIRKKGKEIKFANKKYADAIRPYFIQNVEIDEDIIYGIKNAISIEEEIPLKYFYTNQMLQDVLIYDITTTRYLTEQTKREMISRITQTFSFGRKNDEIEIQTSTNRINYKEVGMFFAMGIIGLVVALAVYYLDPEEAKNPNGVAQFIIIIAMMIALVNMSMVTWKISDLEIVLDGFEERGILGSIAVAEMRMFTWMSRILFGKRNTDNKSEE